MSDASIACVVPLQGDACTEEKKYRKMLTGASSVGILISFMLVPRLLTGIYELIFGVCCRTVFVKSQGKTVKGVSLGVLILAALGVLVLLLIANGGTGFIGLRFTVWLFTWIGSMLIFEPLTSLISYFLLRCGDFKKQSEVDEEESHADDEENPNIVGTGRKVPEDETAPLLGHPAYISSPSGRHIIEQPINIRAPALNTIQTTTTATQDMPTTNPGANVANPPEAPLRPSTTDTNAITPSISDAPVALEEEPSSVSHPSSSSLLKEEVNAMPQPPISPSNASSTPPSNDQ